MKALYIMDGKLNPCPHCKGHSIVALQSDQEHKGQWQGACMKCGRTGPWSKTQKGAIDGWNSESGNKG